MARSAVPPAGFQRQVRRWRQVREEACRQRASRGPGDGAASPPCCWMCRFPTVPSRLRTVSRGDGGGRALLASAPSAAGRLQQQSVKRAVGWGHTVLVGLSRVPRGCVPAARYFFLKEGVLHVTAAWALNCPLSARSSPSFKCGFCRSGPRAPSRASCPALRGGRSLPVSVNPPEAGGGPTCLCSRGPEPASLPCDVGVSTACLGSQSGHLARERDPGEGRGGAAPSERPSLCTSPRAQAGAAQRRLLCQGEACPLPVSQLPL